MTDLTDKQAKLLGRVFKADNIKGMHRTVLEALISAPTDAVADIGILRGGVEVWLNTGISEDEKDNLECLYDIREITVYGDPNLAGTPDGKPTDGKLYLRLDPKE